MPLAVPCILIALLLACCNGPAPTDADRKRAAAETPDRQELLLGETLFDQYCTVCHGRSPHSLGGPSLARRSFRYGRTAAAIRTTIRSGRRKGMPAFRDEFNNVQLKALVRYVLSLSP